MHPAVGTYGIGWYGRHSSKFSFHSDMQDIVIAFLIILTGNVGKARNYLATKYFLKN